MTDQEIIAANETLSNLTRRRLPVTPDGNKPRSTAEFAKVFDEIADMPPSTVKGELMLKAQDEFIKDKRPQPKPKVVVLSKSSLKNPGGIVTPVPGLVEALEELLTHAKSGRLRWFWGTGLTRDHQALTLRAGTATDPYAAAGRLSFLADEYVQGFAPNEE